ncbi:MAG: (Fe-S)-binding protein, partial [Moorella sp. (in: Bacteria)]|nr:(Fe-S)-binding protein [Moorella sp. (in: firmicutes)]
MTARKLLGGRLTRQMVTYLEACTHCGLCSEACHFYLSTGDSHMSPVYKADQLRRLYLRHYRRWGRIFPKRTGPIQLGHKDLQELKEAFFGSCTLCRRCNLNCPFGVDTALLARASRSMLNSLGLTPGGLKEAVEIHLQTGNNMAVSEEEL